MKNLFLMFCSLISTSLTYGQTGRDSLLKNEFGLNLVPVISILSPSAGQHHFSYSGHYKRAITRSLFARLELTYQKPFAGNTFATGAFIKDSNTVYCDYYRKRYKATTQVNLGLEYRWGKGQIRSFAGADLAYKQAEYTKERYYTERYPGSWFSGNAQTTNESIGIDHNDSDSLVSNSRTKQRAFCINAFYGAQFHFSRHFFFSAQLSILAGLDKKVFTNSWSNHPLTTWYTSLDLNLLQNFSLCYRF